MDRIPEIFRSPRDYKTSVAAVEAGHATANEIALYEAIAEAARRKASDLSRPVVICDLCCASGGCAEKALPFVKCSSLYLVDNEPSMIQGARQKNWTSEKTFFELADAVTWKCPEAADIVILNSAYHHIENERKLEFLKNISSMLGNDGVVLVGEHFLPSYKVNDDESYRASVLHFYTERIGYLEKLNTPEEQIRVIRQTGLYCWQQQYEYQVSYEVFSSHVELVGLTITSETRVWPKDNSSLPDKSGSYFVILKKR